MANVSPQDTLCSQRLPFSIHSLPYEASNFVCLRFCCTWRAFICTFFYFHNAASVPILASGGAVTVEPRRCESEREVRVASRKTDAPTTDTECFVVNLGVGRAGRYVVGIYHFLCTGGLHAVKQAGCDTHDVL